MKIKRIQILFAAVISALLLCACSTSNRPVPGTEQTYTGVITDRYMTQVDQSSLRDTSRCYILLRLDDGSEKGFWMAEDYSAPEGATVGTYVSLESAVEENTDLPIATQITILNQNTAAPEKYQDILEGIYYDHILPDGQRLDPYDNPAPEYPNQFAIFDVDGDGRDELIIRYINTYTAGMFGTIYDYDQQTGKLRQQLLEFPALNFYKNGVVEAGWSHNQGLSGRFWPCTLYQYDPDTDTYTELASVDAWDKEFFETDYDGNPFPDEIDVNADHIVYYVRLAGTEGSVAPISQQEFTLWWGDLTGNTQKGLPADLLLDIPYQSLSAQNIADVA